MRASRLLGRERPLFLTFLSASGFGCIRTEGWALFTQPRGGGVLRTSALRSSEKFDSLDLRARLTKLRGCADRLATFPICWFSELSNRVLIASWHIRYPPIRASSKCVEGHSLLRNSFALPSAPE